MAYIYKATLWCDACGELIRKRLQRQGKAPKDPSDEASYDSGDFPKGPVPDDDPSDSPHHCGSAEKCWDRLVLDDGSKEGKIVSGLTEEGRQYVREAGNTPLTRAWRAHYGQRYDVAQVESSPRLILRKLPNGNLEITPTKEGVEEAKELLTRNNAFPDDQLHEMLEYFLCNGWSWVRPENIGALTDAPIISEDGRINDDGEWVPVWDPRDPKPRVYAHMDYAVEDPVETWAKGGAVAFEGVEVEVERKASKFSDAELRQKEQGLCIWQTAYGLPWMLYCKKKAKVGDLCKEHHRDRRYLYPTPAEMKVDEAKRIRNQLQLSRVKKGKSKGKK